MCKPQPLGDFVFGMNSVVTQGLWHNRQEACDKQHRHKQLPSTNTRALKPLFDVGTAVQILLRRYYREHRDGVMRTDVRREMISSAYSPCVSVSLTHTTTLGWILLPWNGWKGATHLHVGVSISL